MNLPDYKAIDLKKNIFPENLRQPARTLIFPLSQQDIHDIRTLEQKFDQEKNCAGLAGPQIGIDKRIIVFAAPDSDDLKKWRSDFTQTMEKTIWINPSYEPIGDEKHTDYEGCFSVINAAGDVARYKKVSFIAYTIEGKRIEGKAEGFLARIIQHEVDHLNGKLFIDYVPEGHLIDVEAYRKMREDAIKNGREF